MKLSRLHSLIKSTQQDIILSNATVVIDANTFFIDNYKNSGCQYILGGEYDRYADYLRNTLNNFKQANVTCYVIFNANILQTDIDSRLEIHKKVISIADSVSPMNKCNVFSEPALFKDVVKQVLEEQQVKYAVSENHLWDLINTAKHYSCSIITKNVEYSLLGVACCAPKSLQFDPQKKFFAAKCYEPISTRQRVNIMVNKLGIILVLLDDNNDFLKDLQNVIRYPLNREVNATLSWIKRQNMQVIMSDISKNLEKTKHERFLKELSTAREFLFGKQEIPNAVKCFTGQRRYDKNNSDWFTEGLTSGKIPVSYAILMKYNLINGSWLVFDKEKEDAMLSAMEIFDYVAAVLSDFTKNNFTFVGRVHSAPQAWNIQMTKLVKPKNIPDWKRHTKYWEHIPDFFVSFLNNRIPGLDLNVINKAPDDCRLLMITLVYYGSNINHEFLYGVYSVLLSYVLLGPVGRVTGLIKRSNLLLSQNFNNSSKDQKKSEIIDRDSFVAAQAVLDLFYVDDSELKKIFDRKLLHYFAEFQHCLLHMNNLNRFCGEKMKCTVYHETYNATFIYKMTLRFKESKVEPMVVVEKLLENSPTVLKFYKNLLKIFYSSCSYTSRIF